MIAGSFPVVVHDQKREMALEAKLFAKLFIMSLGVLKSPMHTLKMEPCRHDNPGMDRLYHMFRRPYEQRNDGHPPETRDTLEGEAESG